MPIPWLRVLDAAFGLTDIARRIRGGSSTALDPANGAIPRQLETRLAGIVVSALKEAFDRDHRRLELEREQVDAERERAERAERLALVRQAADRELSRLRFLTATAVAVWAVTLVGAGTWLAGGMPSRVALGVGWVFLLGAVAAGLVAQSGVTRSADRVASIADEPFRTSPGVAAPWLLVAGFAVVAFGLLLT